MTNGSSDGAANGAGPKGACPICELPASPDFRPFCSRRCADLDLGKWLTGGYAVAAEEEDTPDRTEAQGPQSLDDAEDDGRRH